MQLTIIFDRLRWEEKAIYREVTSLGCATSLIDAKEIVFEVTRRETPYSDIVLQRCMSHYRALYLTKILELNGVNVINPYGVTEVCSNKLLTTLLLVKNGIPMPRTFLTLSPHSVSKVAEGIGFPVVLKPLVGSWGKLISIAKDKDTLQSIIELREQIHNSSEHIYYIQKFVDRPPRDIRAVVLDDEIIACVYRYAPEGEWRTNVARGGKAIPLKPSKELEELILKAAKAVGGGILGVDAMESSEGYLVHEINSNVEFKGAQSATGINIANRLAMYLISKVKGGID